MQSNLIERITTREKTTMAEIRDYPLSPEQRRTNGLIDKSELARSNGGSAVHYALAGDVETARRRATLAAACARELMGLTVRGYQAHSIGCVCESCSAAYERQNRD